MTGTSRYRDTDLRAGLFSLTSGILCLLGYAWAPPDAVSSLGFHTFGLMRLPTSTVFLIWGIFGLLTGPALAFNLIRTPSVRSRLVWVEALGLVMVLLVWAAMGRRMDVAGLAAQSLRLSTPIALGAMAGLLCERSGIINIAIEGMMLFSACIGYTAALYTGSAWWGVLAAMAGGTIMAGLHACLSIRFRVDQIISGIVVNILALGVTGFIRRGFLTHISLDSPSVLPIWKIPFLSDIPVLGKVLFSHQPMVYTMLALTVILQIMLFRTRWGLGTRAIGENPQAADTSGVAVFRMQYINVLGSGIFAGLAGAWFSLETVGRFDELMTGGKGFIALAAMIFGNWTPVGALGGALLFGSIDALQIKLQITGVDIPYQLLGMLPYLVTIVVLVAVVRRADPPAALDQGYQRERSVD